MLVTRQKVLRRFWYAIMPMAQLDAGPQSFTLLGEPIVLWKGAGGKPHALRDRCCHRTARLSKGFVDGDGNIACGYHGWTYDCTGQCVKIPQNNGGAIPSRAIVPSYRCEERYGYAWVALDDPLQSIPEFPEERRTRLPPHPAVLRALGNEPTPHDGKLVRQLAFQLRAQGQFRLVRQPETVEI
jgi:phenylpropionate dioxygenase-like ring-hydroxylating dioxygenase large terminal subunit